MIASDVLEFDTAEGPIELEWSSEAEAGLTFDGAPRWGTRLSWRRAGTKPWRRLVVWDTHPFDAEPLKAAVRHDAEAILG